ncbi:hypothetical protein HPB49_010474 [Dermacentor silvarum]|uniref:Uncharacterized protein n=1 Tax=Dermacentor silvarum TaxID=543639 RepID=A0ACB8C8P0_DERSI|nr:hypothetical protein HPB49_010474 [Dermacentor silvarum]
MVGGWTEHNPSSDPKYLKLAHFAIAQQTAGLTHYSTVLRLLKVETQVVAGVNYKLIFETAPSNCAIADGPYSIEHCKPTTDQVLLLTGFCYQLPVFPTCLPVLQAGAADSFRVDCDRFFDHLCSPLPNLETSEFLTWQRATIPADQDTYIKRADSTTLLGHGTAHEMPRHSPLMLFQVTAENLLSDHFLIHITTALTTSLDGTQSLTLTGRHFALILFPSPLNLTMTGRRASPQRFPVAVAFAHVTRSQARMLTFSVYGVAVNVSNAPSAPSSKMPNFPSVLLLCGAEIVAHGASLEHSRWSALCDGLDSPLHSRSTWYLVKSILGNKPALAPTSAKALAQGTPSDGFDKLTSL